jgi:hypothetical protein
VKIKHCTIGQAKQLSLFESEQEFQDHAEELLWKHNRDFTKGEQVGLKKLVHFSLNIPGVSCLPIDSIIKETEKESNGNGISRSTYKRMIKKAKALGVMRVHKTERNNGQWDCNMYVFLPFPKYVILQEFDLS